MRTVFNLDSLAQYLLFLLEDHLQKEKEPLKLHFLKFGLTLASRHLRNSSKAGWCRSPSVSMISGKSCSTQHAHM